MKAERDQSYGSFGEYTWVIHRYMYCDVPDLLQLMLALHLEQLLWKRLDIPSSRRGTSGTSNPITTCVCAPAIHFDALYFPTCEGVMIRGHGKEVLSPTGSSIDTHGLMAVQTSSFVGKSSEYRKGEALVNFEERKPRCRGATALKLVQDEVYDAIASHIS